MRLNNKLWTGAVGLAVLTVFGTLGYVWIEGVSLLDALYMVAITITTVGFSEIHPLNESQRIFTIILIMGGVFTIAYGATTMVGMVVGEGDDVGDDLAERVDRAVQPICI